MRQIKLRAVFMRGGTSKAIVFRQQDLPGDRAAWVPLFLGVIGSPDPNGRQLDGLGRGISSLTKVCVGGSPTRPDAEVDYTFAQVSIKEAAVDFSGNCATCQRRSVRSPSMKEWWRLQSISKPWNK